MKGCKPLRKGVLTLDDEGTILDIGTLEEESESTEFYDGILVPGFVNSHCHIELSHLKGIIDTGTGMAGFIREINSKRHTVSKEEIEHRIAVEMGNLYSGGVSAMADICNNSDSFYIKSKSPIYTRSFLEVFGTDEKSVPDIIKTVKELKKEAERFGLDAVPTPHSCYSTSRALIKESAGEALKEGWISYHNQESWEENLLLKYGTGPLAREYENRGWCTPEVTGKPSLFYFLDIINDIETEQQQKILLVHNTFTNEQSVKYAEESRRDIYWAVCPLSNLYIHKALPPLELFRHYNLKITLGTDSLSSNHNLSLTDEIKCIQQFFPNIPLQEIFEWSSCNGAGFLGVDNVYGSFEKGKRPGIVLVDNIDYRTMKLTAGSKSTRIV